jgi:tetratricopeptide (TPR) repeat protein
MCSMTVRSRLGAGALTLAASVLLTLTAACGGHYVARGADLYDDGRYVEAAEVFERTEQRLAQSPSDERARFGLYRGANFLKLGDAVHAARWLGYARSVVKSDPDALDSGELALLEASLKALASAKPALPEQKSNTEIATAPTH